MRRFYKEAAVEPVDDSYRILLDGRPVKTPARSPLAVRSEALAQAIAEEWNAQGEQVDPRSMPLTGLANAAIDRVAPDKEKFARGLAVFGESDLVCYRAEGPQRLVERQSERWDPIIAWARRRYDIDLEVVCGIIHRPQPKGALDQLAQAVDARSPFELAALSPLVTVSGSLVVALALAEGGIDLETAWAAASLEEQWQIEQWGEDSEAMKALEARRRDFEAGYRFLALL